MGGWRAGTHVISLSSLETDELELHIAAYDAKGNRSMTVLLCKIPPPNPATPGGAATPPATGDPSSPMTWALLLGASGLGMAAMKRRKK